jgi:predicted transcriptional regulator
MSRPRSPGAIPPALTSAELDVMKTLWRAGPQSARELHDSVRKRSGWAYSTTRTVVERMVAKGLVRKSAWHGLHVYEAAVSRPAGLASLVRSFAEDVLELKSVPIATLFAESEALSGEELSELRRLLETTPRPTKRSRR